MTNSLDHQRLLTNTDEIIRVKGPLHTKISSRHDKLVLIDGQGLGHTPDFADLVKRLEKSILQFLEKPVDWSRRPKDEDEAEAVLSPIRQQVSAAMHDLSRTRIGN
jgi:hypothetical protein